jgi:hypothetical protein
VLSLAVLFADGCGSSTPRVCGSAPDASVPHSADIDGPALVTVQTQSIGPSGGTTAPVEPLWIGHQDSDGIWQPLSGNDGTYSFQTTSEAYGVAVICPALDANASTTALIVEATFAEARQLTFLCVSPPNGTFEVLLAPPEGNTNEVWLGHVAPDAITGQGGADFTFSVTAGLYDLVVGTRPVLTSDPMQFQFTRAYPSASANPYTPDLGTSPMFTETAASATVVGFASGRGQGDQLTSDFVTAGGTWVHLTTWPSGTSSSSGSIAFSTIPPAAVQSGDLHRIYAGESSGVSTVSDERYDSTPGAGLTLTLPSALSAAQVVPSAGGCLSDGGSSTPELSWSPSPGTQLYVWLQQFPGGQVAQTILSAGWLGGRSTYAISGFQTAVGWSDQWIPEGLAGSWTLSALNSNLGFFDAVQLVDATRVLGPLSVPDGTEVQRATISSP